MREEYIYKNFDIHFPQLANLVVDYSDAGYFELVIRLKDGQVIIYDDLTITVRTLPPDVDDLTEEQYRIEFGKRLERIMLVKNIMQKDLSEMTGITQASISHYITGRNAPSFYNAKKIAKALNCSVEDLIIKY